MEDLYSNMSLWDIREIESRLQKLQQRFRQTLHFITYLRNGYDFVFAVDTCEIYAYLNPTSQDVQFSSIFLDGPNNDTKNSARNRLALAFLVNNPHRPAVMLSPHVFELYAHVRKQTTRWVEPKRTAPSAWNKWTSHQDALLQRVHRGESLSHSESDGLLELLKKAFDSIFATATDYLHFLHFGNGLNKLIHLLSDRRILFYGTGGKSDLFPDIDIPILNELQKKLHESFLQRRPDATTATFSDAIALSLVDGLNRRLNNQRVLFVTRAYTIESVLSQEFPELFQYFCSPETFFFLSLWNEGEEAWWYNRFDAEISAALAAIESIKSDHQRLGPTIKQSLEAIGNSLSNLINQRLGTITAKHKWLFNEMRDSTHLELEEITSLTDKRSRSSISFVRFVSQDKQFRQRLSEDTLKTWDVLGSAVDRLRQSGRFQSAYSCFISYSSKDSEFVKKFAHDLKDAGVKCWFAPTNVKAGDDFSQEIENAIRMYDRLIVVLSEASLDSKWVRSEVEAGIEIENRRNKLVVIPLKLDDTSDETDRAWAANLRRSRHIADFKEWENTETYDTAFQRLLDDLRPQILGP